MIYLGRRGGQVVAQRRPVARAYWLNIRDNVKAKLNTVKPFARRANGRISTVYLEESLSTSRTYMLGVQLLTRR